MTIDSRNINSIWCSIIAETFYKLGAKTAIICPGSRSTPLAIAFAQHSHIETIPILDERSASFFALGIAKKAGIPTILICTSGTAGANFYPAIIEAKYSNIPLIILTADRPFSLRNCHAGQTIDQVKLYGNFPNYYTELSLPAIAKEMLFYLRQNIIQIWEKSLFPYSGVVHVNLPFDEPLFSSENINLSRSELTFLEQELFDNLAFNLPKYNLEIDDLNNYLKDWNTYDKGIIIAGIDHTFDPQLYALKVSKLAKKLNFPVLAEALSPIRNYAELNPYLITTYDLILRDKKNLEKITPQIVIQIGELPTSKELRNWLNILKAKTFIIKNIGDNIDAIHSNSIHLRISIEKIKINENEQENIDLNKSKNKNLYLKNWLKLEQEKTKNINQQFNKINNLFEGKIAWLLSQYLPTDTNIFIANSMSVRYCEFFWQKNNQNFTPYFNRGTNGIDGTLSTALGIAHNSKNTVLLTGDLALLHDTNGFLINNYFQGNLTIILINNNGGGIFQTLAIAKLESLFEDYFATPQHINFVDICKTYKIEYQLIDNWETLKSLLNPLSTKGIRLLEIKTNRQEDSLWMQNNYPFL